MKSLKKLILWIVFLIIILFLAYLFTNWVTVVKNWYERFNKLFYAILFIIFLYYLIFYTIKPIYFKWFKIINTFIWLWIIFISQYFIINSWVDGIFYGDILCIIWVILTIIWPTNLLISKKDQKEKDLEIIEV